MTKDFAFIDLKNIQVSTKDFLNRKGFSDEEISEYFDFSRMFEAESSEFWPKHERRYIYFSEGEEEELLNWIGPISNKVGYIVRKGRSRHRKNDKSQQKGVDVLLAIEAMQSSYKRVMTHCTIYSNDGDFLPLVDELVSNGTFVCVRSFANPDVGETAPSFRSSSDAYFQFDEIFLYHCLKAKFSIRSFTLNLKPKWEFFESHLGNETLATILENDDKYVARFQETDGHISSPRSALFDNKICLEIWKRLGAPTFEKLMQSQIFPTPNFSSNI